MLRLKRLVYRFLANRRGIRRTDIFIVTYPKSGGSWFYTLIANVLKKDDEDYLDLWSASKYIPDVNDIYFAGKSFSAYAHMSDPRFFFVHAPYDPIFPKVVYVLRDVRGVLVSYYHWSKMKRPGFDLSLHQFVAKDDHWPCRWDEHVDGWLFVNREVPLLMVRYEDLLKDTAKELSRALQFCGVCFTDGEVLRAVEASSFERMHKAEQDRTDFMHPKVDSKRMFVRRGEAGGWEDELNELTIELIMLKYGHMLEKLGYL